MLCSKLETPASSRLSGICLGLGAALTLGLSSWAYGQDCGAGDVSSEELCLVDEDADTVNGGCNSNPAVFEPANVGGSINGTVSTYLVAGVETRDTDWYLVTPKELAAADIDGNGLVRLSHSGSSEAPIVLFIVAIGDPLCDSAAVIGTTGFAGPDCAGGEPSDVIIDINDHPNGIAYFVATGNPDGSSITSGFECATGNNDYVITMEITEPPTTCAPGSGNCAVANGSPGCEDPACCAAVCEQDPGCCEVEWDEFCAAAALKIGCAALTCDPDGTTVGDNIGGNAGSLTGNGFASQRFPDFPDFDIVALDDFTVGGGGVIVTCVDMSAFGFDGFENEDWTLVESWQVEIYSSPEAAAANLTGDVASISVPAPLVEPFGAQDLLRIDLTGGPGPGIDLAPGTYWIGMIPTMPFDVDGCCGQVAVGGTTIGNADAWQANPGGGFEFPDGLQQIAGGVNLAYRVVGTELKGEPCPWDLDGGGSVGAADLLDLLFNWGPCPGCATDFDGDDIVGASDLLAMLFNWGPCP